MSLKFLKFNMLNYLGETITMNNKRKVDNIERLARSAGDLCRRPMHAREIAIQSRVVNEFR